MITNNVLEDKVGGHERYVRELSSILAGRGHEVTIVAKRWVPSQPPRETCPDGVVLERHEVPSKRNPLYAGLYGPNLIRQVRRHVLGALPPDVIHVHMGLPGLGVVAARRPYLFTFHAPVWRELLSERQGTYVLPPGVQHGAVRGMRAVERSVLRHSTRVTVLSEFMRDEVAQLDPAAAQTAEIIPGGIDLSRFAPAEPRGTGATVFGDHAGVTLFTARRLTPRTGVDLLIRAMPPILGRHPDARLFIAGSGPQEEPLAALARETGVAHRIRLLGRISDAELVAAYRAATLVVLPTRELEGFGLTTAEALACGGVVVGTPAGATPELLHRLHPDLITASLSPSAIAEAVNRMLENPARLEALRDAARAVVAPAMGWPRVAARFLELYEGCATQLRSGGRSR